jgi:hypothetical protein
MKKIISLFLIITTLLSASCGRAEEPAVVTPEVIPTPEQPIDLSVPEPEPEPDPEPVIIDESVVEIEPEPEPEPEPVVTTTPTTTTQPPQTTPIIQAPPGVEAHIAYNDDGPVIQIQHGTGGGNRHPGELGLEIMRLLDSAVPTGFQPFVNVTFESFTSTVALVRGADLAQVIQMANVYDSNLQAIMQTAERAGVSMTDISMGNASAQEEYNVHVAILQVIRQAIAGVERERTVAESE